VQHYVRLILTFHVPITHKLKMYTLLLKVFYPQKNSWGTDFKHISIYF